MPAAHTHCGELPIGVDVRRTGDVNPLMSGSSAENQGTYVPRSPLEVFSRVPELPIPAEHLDESQGCQMRGWLDQGNEGVMPVGGPEKQWFIDKLSARVMSMASMVM